MICSRDREEQAALTQVAEFRRHRRGKHQTRSPWQMPNAPWRSLAVLVGVAAALWFAAGLHHPGIMNRSAPNPSGGLVMDGNGTFALCARAGQQSCVIDGDTVRYGGLTIRLEDIDAPETRSPKCTAEAALGRQATERLLELINAGPFRVVHTGGRDEDRYGRKLRVIERQGRSVGDTLIAEGLARRWDGARRSWCG
jgi:endonuclease YncB( thermonuclease family)